MVRDNNNKTENSVKIGAFFRGNQQEGFLRCQTPTSTVRLKVEGCRVKNGGCRIESEEWRV